MVTETQIKTCQIDTEANEHKIQSIYDFALVGKTERLNKLIEKLKNMAEEETWNLENENIPNKILHHYFMGTFLKCHRENKIIYSENNKYCCFNTGLLTNHGEDILCLFEPSKTKGILKWYLEGFHINSERIILKNFKQIPEVCCYFNDPADLLFNVKADIWVNYQHILDDNWEERFPDELRNLGKDTIISMMKGAIDITKKRIQRNHRLVIPLYYKNKITYLLPLKLRDYYLALVTEKFDDDKYRANTIFTPEMAYMEARLLMKPETNWLTI